MRFVYRPDDPRSDKNGMLEVSLAWPKHVSNKLVPSIISDEMPPTRHMVDCKMYTSKSEFRKATKAAGCVEVGNETSTLTKPRSPVPLSREKRRDDIRRAVYQLRNS